MNTKTSSADPANSGTRVLWAGKAPMEMQTPGTGTDTAQAVGSTELKALMLLIQRNAAEVRAKVWVEWLTLPQPWFQLLPELCSGCSSLLQQLLSQPGVAQMRRDWFGRSQQRSCNTTDEGEETIYCPK